MNKQAQVGSTITWFFAVIATFLILLIFLVFSGAIAAQKVSVRDLVLGIDESGQTYSTNYFSFRTLVLLLESPLNSEKVFSIISEPKYFVSGLNYRTEILEVFEGEDCSNIYLLVFDTFWCEKALGEVHCGETNKEYLTEEIHLDTTSVAVPFVSLKLPLTPSETHGWTYLPIKLAARYNCEK